MGIALTAAFDLAGLVVAQFLPTPVGARMLITFAVLLGLIGGSVPGWAYRETLRAHGLGRVALKAVAVTVAFLLLYVWVTSWEPGMLMTLLCLVLAAGLGAGFGALCAIAGIRIDGA